MSLNSRMVGKGCAGFAINGETRVHEDGRNWDNILGVVLRRERNRSKAFCSSTKYSNLKSLNFTLNNAEYYPCIPYSYRLVVGT